MRYSIITATAVALLSSPALAHAFLDVAVPEVGSTVATAPKEIRIVFTGEIEPAFSHIHLYDSGGAEVPTGQAVAGESATQLAVPVQGALLPGHYEVRWDVVSVDTHKTDGHFSFDYKP